MLTNMSSVRWNGPKGSGSVKNRHHEGPGGTLSGNLVSIVTEASTAPTVTKMVLGASRNAIRVFADFATAVEPFFYLYAKRNSDAVQKIKIYPWSARILASAPGDRWAFGTNDGRTLAMAAMTHPAVLETSFPVTGAANADNGCPPYWSPSAAHITLAATGSAFQLADTSTSEVVFIREYDGSQWSPPRWVRKQSGRATTVRCTYKTIALATLNGATLSIAAPTGALIGGASMSMTNSYMPTASGTTRSVNNVATLKSAMAAAVAGDEIVLVAGTYALDVEVTNSLFTANNGIGGRTGMGGILFRGATGNAADVVLTGDLTGNHGYWLLDADTVSFCGFKYLTFDFTGTLGCFQPSGGKVALQDVMFKGIAAGDPGNVLAIFVCAHAPITVECLRVTGQDSAGDCIDTFYDTPGSANALASRTRFVSCTAVRAAPTDQANQCISAHGGVSMEWYGGLLSDALNNVAAPDALTSGMYLFFTTVTKGSHSSGLLNTYLYGCTIDGATYQTSNIGGDGGARFNIISLVPTTANSCFTNCTQAVEHNLLTCTDSSKGAFGVRSQNNSSITDGFRYNIVLGFSNGIDTGGSSGAGGTTAFYGNTIVASTSSGTCGARLEDTHLAEIVKNNACKGDGTGVYAPVITGLTTDYNVFESSAGLFVAGVHDIVSGDAALDGFYFPTANGNCDGNGDTSVESFIGDSDPWGYVRVYAASRVSRGARDRPSIYPGAYIYPDLF